MPAWQKYPKTAKVLLGVAALMLFVATCLAVYALVISWQAKRLLADIRGLRVGVSTSEDAHRVIEKHRRRLRSQDCTDKGCSYQFTIENKWLAKALLEPETRFDASIYIAKGRVTHLFVSLARAMPIYPTFQASAGMTEEFVEMPQYARSNAHYMFPTPIGKPYLAVQLDSHATLEQRQHAFGFDFRCFVKPGGGCDLPCDYLPAAWQDWKDSLQLDKDDSQLFFDQHYPDNQRCDAKR
jgi:hypothetical protein